MNKIILILGIATILTACAQVAKADSGVTIERATVIYTLRGASHVELYHDALLVCRAGAEQCTAVIDDRQAVDAWAMPSCERAAVWTDTSEEPLAIVGCDMASGMIEVVR